MHAHLSPITPPSFSPRLPTRYEDIVYLINLFVPVYPLCLVFPYLPLSRSGMSSPCSLGASLPQMRNSYISIHRPYSVNHSLQSSAPISCCSSWERSPSPLLLPCLINEPVPPPASWVGSRMIVLQIISCLISLIMGGSGWCVILHADEWRGALLGVV